MNKNTARAAHRGPVLTYKETDPEGTNIIRYNDCVNYNTCLLEASRNPKAEGFTCEGCDAQEEKRSSGDRSTLFLMPELYRLMDVPLDRIIINFEIEEKSFRNLARSVTNLGVIQPVVLVEDDDGFRVFAGKRRILSALSKGLRDISAKVFRKGTPESLLTIYSIAENMNRSANPADEAEKLCKVMQSYNWTPEEASKRLSIPVQHIRGRLKLTQLIPEYFEMLKKGVLKVTMANRICVLPKENQQELLGTGKLTGEILRNHCRDFKFDALLSREELFELPVCAKDPLDEIQEKLLALIAKSKRDTKTLQDAVILIDRYRQGGEI